MRQTKSRPNHAHTFGALRDTDRLVAAAAPLKQLAVSTMHAAAQQFLKQAAAGAEMEKDNLCASGT